MRAVKQVIVVRHDLNAQLTKGKFGAMVAHASVHCAVEVNRNDINLWDAWGKEGFVKIVLQVTDLVHLTQIEASAKAAGLFTCKVTDSAKTVFTEPTTVSLAIGPGDATKIDLICKDLKLW